MKRALILSGGGSRGAFQAGVWKYLVEKNWKPDMICGTSIGAVNAVAIGSGMDVGSLEHFWTTVNRRRLYRLNLVPFLARTFLGRGIEPLMDNRPMKVMLKKAIDFGALRKSPFEIVITAVNVRTASPRFFTHREIRLEHVLASSAMPLIFPWQEIDRDLYWDGGVMDNTPLLPAIAAGADEIIVVFLSPVGNCPQPLPMDTVTAGEHVFEQFLTGPHRSAMTALGYSDLPSGSLPHSGGGLAVPGTRRPSIITLAPEKMLGFGSLLNFSLKQARDLVDQGYRTASARLAGRV